MIPERILVEICISSPENYDADIQEFLAKYQEVEGSITVPSSWLPAQATATPAFAFYKTTPEAMVCFFRTKNKRALEEAMQNSELVHARLREKLARDGIAVSFQVSRQVLRTFLLRNISRTKAYEEAMRFQEREIKNFEELYGTAETLFPHATEEEIRYYTELGYGDTPEEIISNGALMVELFSEGKNPSEAELCIDDCIELFYRYIDAGFPQDAESVKDLKDALSMDMVNPKDFYERVLQRSWPAQVPILNAASEDIS